MSLLKRKRNIVIATIAAAALIGAGTVAYAAFTSVSSVQASSSSGNLSDLTIANKQFDYPNNEHGLWPNVDNNGNTPTDPATGNHVTPVELQVYNPNEVAVSVSPSGITEGAQFNDSTVGTTCDKFLNVIGPTLSGGVPVVVPAHGSKWIMVSAIYLHGDAPNACAAQPFTTTWSFHITAL
jgi:hypothetical protein